MSIFAKGAAMQYSNTLGMQKLNLLKFKIDKFITDFAGLSEPLVTSAKKEDFFKLVTNISIERSKSILPLLDYVHSITANSTSTFGINRFKQDLCLSISETNLSLYDEKDLFIPQDFCRVNSDGQTANSFMNSIIWLTGRESKMFEKISVMSPQTILSLYRSNEYITHDLFVNLLAEVELVKLQKIFVDFSVTLNTDFNMRLKDISLYGVLLLSLSNVFFYILF
jgi:hypothetical protein